MTCCAKWKSVGHMPKSAVAIFEFSLMIRSRPVVSGFRQAPEGFGPEVDGLTKAVIELRHHYDKQGPWSILNFWVRTDYGAQCSTSAR